MRSVSRADMLALWSADEMTEFSGAFLSQSGMPDEAVHVLVEVGLPSSVEPFFFADGSVRKLSADHQVEGWRFGGDGGADLCLDANTGQVVADGTEVGAPVRFVNSSLQQFAACLCAVAGSYRKFKELDDDAIDSLIGSLEAELGQIDAAALAGEENWWAVLLEQMRDGLL